MATEVKPGMRVRHKASGKEETVITIFKSKEGGKWHDAVLYQGIDRETGKMATFGRDMGDFLANFEPAEGTVLGDDLPFTGEPFTAKGKDGRNCEACHWLRTADGNNVCGIWNTRIADTERVCKDFTDRRNCATCRNYDKDGDLCALWNSPVECAGLGCPDYRE